MSLTDQQTALLAIERQWWQRPGRKEQAMHDAGLTPTEYYRQLTLLIDSLDALALDPVTVNRLRRLRDQRASQRQRLRTA